MRRNKGLHVKRSQKKPAKPATKQDVTLRAALSDLLGRNQIPVLAHLARNLGFKASNQINYFLTGQRNYPVKMVPKAITALRDIYGFNEKFLKEGQGKMYKDKPYEITDNYSVVNEDPTMMLTLGARARLDDLIKKHDQLVKEVEALNRILKDKERIIETQDELLATLKRKKPGQ